MLGCELGRTDPNGGGGGWCELHGGTAQGTLDLLGDNKRRGERGVLLFLGGRVGLLSVLLDPLAIRLLDLSDTNGNWALARLVEDLSEGLHQAHGDTVVSQEDIVLGKQLATALKALVAGLQFRETNNLLDAGGKALGEGWVGNDIFNATLGVGSNQTDTERGRCVERVRDADFSGLQSVLVDYMLLGGENEPDGFVLGRAVLAIGVIVANQGLLCASLLLFLLRRLDVLQQRGGSFEDLIEVR